MVLKPGFYIRLLKPVEAGEVFLSKGEVVEVVEVSKKGPIVRDIIGDEIRLPKEAKFKLVRTSKKDLKVIASSIKTGTVIIGSDEKPYLPRLRSVQLAQMITSNALVVDDPIVLSRLSIASSILAMSLAPDLDMNQYSRLYQYAKKLSVI